MAREFLKKKKKQLIFFFWPLILTDTQRRSADRRVWIYTDVYNRSIEYGRTVREWHQRDYTCEEVR